MLERTFAQPTMTECIGSGRRARCDYLLRLVPHPRKRPYDFDQPVVTRTGRTPRRNMPVVIMEAPERSADMPRQIANVLGALLADAGSIHAGVHVDEESDA